MSVYVCMYACMYVQVIWVIQVQATCVAGVGWAMLVVSFLVSIYYNVVIAYILRYLFASFTSSLPWQSCRLEWLQYGCQERDKAANGNSAAVH